MAGPLSLCVPQRHPLGKGLFAHKVFRTASLLVPSTPQMPPLFVYEGNQPFVFFAANHFLFKFETLSVWLSRLPQGRGRGEGPRSFVFPEQCLGRNVYYLKTFSEP